MRIARCGVCHSDLHMQDGYFTLGDGKQLDVRAGRTLPFTLGHEIAGTSRERGPEADAQGRAQASRSIPGSAAAQCAACTAGDENICAAPRHLGITVDGGFATPCAGAASALSDRLRAAAGRLRRRADVLGPDRLCRAQAAGRPRRRAGRCCWSALGGVGMMGLALRARCSARRPRRRHRRRANARRPWRPAPRRRSIRPTRARARRCCKASGGIYAAMRFRRLRQIAQFRHRRAGQGRQGGGHRPDRRRLFDAGRHVPAQGHDDRGHADRHAGRSARVDRAGAREEDRAAADQPSGRSAQAQRRSTICAPGKSSGAWC